MNIFLRSEEGRVFLEKLQKSYKTVILDSSSDIFSTKVKFKMEEKQKSIVETRSVNVNIVICTNTNMFV